MDIFSFSLPMSDESLLWEWRSTFPFFNNAGNFHSIVARRNKVKVSWLISVEKKKGGKKLRSIFSVRTSWFRAPSSLKPNNFTSYGAFVGRALLNFALWINFLSPFGRLGAGNLFIPRKCASRCEKLFWIFIFLPKYDLKFKVHKWNRWSRRGNRFCVSAGPSLSHGLKLQFLFIFAFILNTNTNILICLKKKSLWGQTNLACFCVNSFFSTKGT